MTENGREMLTGILADIAGGFIATLLIGIALIGFYDLASSGALTGNSPHETHDTGEN